jgi:hypothetical protein
MRDPYPVHGPIRRWRKPWVVVCRCGMNAYPCAVQQAPDLSAPAEEIYTHGLRYAQGSRDGERRWPRGTR